ncbi:hypothetical protein Tco_0147326, partial [Tanacetum coccineum]
KRLGDELEQPSSKRPKDSEVEATSAAMEDTRAQLPISSEDVRTSKECEVMEEKLESLERTPRKRKSVARKGLYISKSTIPIDTEDPDAEYKMCLKYASDEEDDSDCDTLFTFYAVVDWELLPTGLGTINVIYRKDNSLKYFTSLREILYFGVLRVLIDSLEVDDGSEFWKSQHKWRIQSWKLYSWRKRRQIAKQKAKARRDRPMSQAEQRDFMRTFVKNHSSAIYNKGWTMTYVKSLSADRLKEAFERLQSHL